MAGATTPLRVKVSHGDFHGGLPLDGVGANSSGLVEIQVAEDGSDSLLEVKGKIAAHFNNVVSADQLMLEFGPNDRKLGQTYYGETGYDEATLKLSDYSVLHWLSKFPHWYVMARMLPPPPPVPGYAAHRAAALGRGDDPDKAVADAVAAGDLLPLEQYPAPWGNAPPVEKEPKIFDPIAETDDAGRPSAPASFGIGGDSFIHTAGAMAPDGTRLGYDDVTSTPTPMPEGAHLTPYDNVAGRKQ